MRDIFSSFSSMMVCYVFSLESPHRGDSNEYIQHTIINIYKTITRNYPKYNNVHSYRSFFVRTQERVRNNRNVVNELPVFDPLKFYY